MTPVLSDRIDAGRQLAARLVGRFATPPVVLALPRGGAPLAVQGRDVVLVDDGLATGTTARAAILALRRNQPASLTLAVPVAPEDTVRELQPLVDALVCLAMPEPFRAIGLHYDDFHQLDDEEVIEVMERFNPRRSPE